MTIQKNSNKRKGISTAAKKSKGRRLQQFVRDLILSLNPELEEDDCKSTSMGAGGEDVQLSPAARKLVPLSIECKSVAKFAGYKYLDQADSNSKEHQPVAVVKANHRKPIVLVDAEYFFNLIKDNYGT